MKEIFMKLTQNNEKHALYLFLCKVLSIRKTMKKEVRKRLKKRKTTIVMGMTIALSFKKIKTVRMILKKKMTTMKVKLFRISN